MVIEVGTEKIRNIFVGHVSVSAIHGIFVQWQH